MTDAPDATHNMRHIYDAVKDGLRKLADLDIQAQAIGADREKVKSELEALGITRSALQQGKLFRNMTEDQRRVFKQGSEIVLSAIEEMEKDGDDGQGELAGTGE